MNWQEKVQQREKLLFGLAIAFLLSMALLVGIRTEGVSTDEEIERTSSLVNYKYLVSSVEDISTESVDFSEIPVLHEWRDRAYGVTLQLPTVIIEHLFGFQLDLSVVYQIRHLYTFALFALSAVFFYFICRDLFGGKWYGLLGVGILVISPRILTEAFYNIKDIIFLSIFIINVYFCLCFMKGRTWKRALGLALTTALCVNARIIGAMAIVFCLAILLVQQIKNKVGVREYIWIFGTGFLSILFYIAVTPFLWENPAAGIWETLRTFTDFTRYGGDVYYMGNVFPASDLPWHYLPVCMLATIPLGYSLLAAAGVFSTIGRGKKNGPASVFLLLLLVVPVAYAVFCRPTLYNMWRHMYFLYPLLALQAVGGIRFLWKRKRRWVKGAATVLAALSLGFTAVWLVFNSPYGYVYFNPAARLVAETWFEKDYWGLSTAEMAKKIFEIDADREEYKVHFYILGGYYALDQEQRDRIQVTWNDSESDFTIYQYFSQEGDPELNRYYFYPKEYAVRADGMEIAALYDSHWDIYSQSKVTETEGEALIYTANGMKWSRQPSAFADEVCLEGVLSYPIWSSHITVEYENGTDISDLTVEMLTKDGWKEAKKVLLYGNIGHYYLAEPEEILQVRLNYKKDREESIWRLNLHRLSFPEENEAFAGESVIAAGTGYFLTEVTEDRTAFDNDITTRWSKGQKPGTTYQIELREPMTIREMQLVLGDSNYDWARALQIFVSEDGENWQEISFTGRLNADILFDKAAECRYVQLRLGGTEEEIKNNWSIHEIVLYEQEESR